MSNKLSATITTIAVLISTLAACQMPLKSTALNQSIEESPITLVLDIPDSDGDGVLDDRDECPETLPTRVVDKLGCSMPMDLMSLITMEYRAFFSKGGSELLPKYQLELDKVAEQMKKYDTATMKIEAHVSEDEVDQELSALPKNRALMIKNYLVLKRDIEPSRLSTFDCGVRAPIAPSNTEESKSFNRRVYGLVKEPKGEIAYQQPNDLKSKTCIEF